MSTEEQLEAALDALEAMARQACVTDSLGVTDSGAITAHGEALEVLDAHERFRIAVEPVGRMVCGYWPEHDPFGKAE